jgi:hypothetical protein
VAAAFLMEKKLQKSLTFAVADDDLCVLASISVYIYYRTKHKSIWLMTAAFLAFVLLSLKKREKSTPLEIT